MSQAISGKGGHLGFLTRPVNKQNKFFKTARGRVVVSLVTGKEV
jgi:predicted alpha/beta-fold hydrolase